MPDPPGRPIPAPWFACERRDPASGTSSTLTFQNGDVGDEVCTQDGKDAPTPSSAEQPHTSGGSGVGEELKAYG